MQSSKRIWHTTRSAFFFQISSVCV
jgi:hypothetical protein